MGELNTQFKMSTARHPRKYWLMERVNQNIQTLLRYYGSKFGLDWVTHLSMAAFYYNCPINEATAHSPFEVLYG
jgi:hypothetical protein